MFGKQEFPLINQSVLIVTRSDMGLSEQEKEDFLFVRRSARKEKKKKKRPTEISLTSYREGHILGLNTKDVRPNKDVS